MGLSALVRAFGTKWHQGQGGSPAWGQSPAQDTLIHTISETENLCFPRVVRKALCAPPNAHRMSAGSWVSAWPGQRTRRGEGTLLESLGHWEPRVSPDTPISLQMVIGVGLLDRGEKRGRSVPEKGVSGKTNSSDPSVAL